MQDTLRLSESDRRRPASGVALPRAYAVELPADALDQDATLLDRVIGDAFDTLGATRLTLRVTARGTTDRPSADGRRSSEPTTAEDLP